MWPAPCRLLCPRGLIFSFLTVLGGTHRAPRGLSVSLGLGLKVSLCEKGGWVGLSPCPLSSDQVGAGRGLSVKWEEEAVAFLGRREVTPGLGSREAAGSPGGADGGP